MSLTSLTHRLTLTELPRLRSLNLTDGVFAEFPDSMIWLSELLATVTEPCRLEEISINHSVRLVDVTDIPQSVWLMVDKTLTSNDLPRFQNLTFKSYNKFHILDDKAILGLYEKLANNLHTLHTRGCLHVSHGGLAPGP